MGKNVREYIDGFQGGLFEDVITVEHRSNNPKRDYLFVNRWQGKHIPVEPKKMEFMFSCLDDKIREVVPKDAKVVVVGFAETATAIGWYVARNLKNCGYYLQTTREEIPGAKKLIEFKEEHSHATNQQLYGSKKILNGFKYATRVDGQVLDFSNGFDYVLFVEDEISTGKTILNFIEEFDKVKPGMRFGVASICNWQNEASQEAFNEKEIDRVYLISGTLKDVNAKMAVEVMPDVTEFAADYLLGTNRDFVEEVRALSDRALDGSTEPVIKCYKIKESVFREERVGKCPLYNHDGAMKQRAADMIYWDILESAKTEDVLVLGTEEFMSIPADIAHRLQVNAPHVWFHATTRSPIDVMCDDAADVYSGIINKYKLHSNYEDSRVTYVYNLRKYDKAIVVCDKKLNPNFAMDISAALYDTGTALKDITFLVMEDE